MMVVEFCKYGNLSNYLRGKRDDFIVYKVGPEVNTARAWLSTWSHLRLCLCVLFSVRTVRVCRRYQELS